MSVISFTTKELEDRSVVNLGSLQNFVPNLTFAPAQNVGDAAGNIFIRGIGQEDFVAGSEPGVGLYIDGVYVARTMGNLQDLIDVDRIEVLRGPQGTLYGKNTIGGAINIITMAPRQTTDGSVDLTLGNLGTTYARSTLNVALSERLLLRISGGHSERDGYLRRLKPSFAPTAVTETDHRDEGRDHRIGGRVQLRWLASDRWVVDLTADGSRRRGAQGATHLDAIDPRFGIIPVVNQLISEGKLPGPEITADLSTNNLLASYAGAGNRLDQDVAGASLVVSGEVGAQKLRLTGAYRRLRSDVATDLDGTYFALFSVSEFDERYHQLSGEFQLEGTAGSVDYTAGLFAMHEAGELLPVRGVGQDVLYYCGCFYPPENLPPTLFPERQVASTSHAIYGQASFPVANRLTTTLGVRYSHDRKSVDAQLTLLDPDTLQPTNQVAASGRNSGHWGSFTWRAGMEFQPTPALMAYVSAAKGFKSGGFNVRPSINLPNLGLAEFAPENATTYEAGVRSEWLQRRLRLNLTVFYTSYHDIQLRQQTIFDGIVTTLIENAARARIRGLEVEATARPVRDLTLGLAYGHLTPKYLDVGRVPGLTLQTDFQRTPHDTLTAYVDYERPFASGRIGLHGDYSLRSREQFQLTATPRDQQAYAIVGARLSFRERRDRWSVALYGTNLTDRHYRTAGRGTLITQTGFAYSSVGLPRQVGVEAKLSL